MKLKDLDIDLNELETDIIKGSAIHWLREAVSTKIAGDFIEEHGKELMASIKIDKNELRQRVIDKMADEIIDYWRSKGETI